MKILTIFNDACHKILTFPPGELRAGSLLLAYFWQDHEIPRVIKDGVHCGKKAAFAIGATGRFWAEFNLQDVNERT